MHKPFMRHDFEGDCRHGRGEHRPGFGRHHAMGDGDTFGRGDGGRHDHGRHEHGGFGGGPRGRARRGGARYLLLDALKDGPKHGYEIIKALEERSAGQYIPSPGTVYPTMQLLIDLGMVEADQEAERRVFRITEAGRAELAKKADEIAAFWSRFEGNSASPAVQHEINFLREDTENLVRTVWGGLRPFIDRGDLETIRKVRAALERTKNEIRAIIAEADTISDDKEV